MIVDGARFPGRVPCLACRHSRRQKTAAEWRSLCGTCRNLADDEIALLHWYQEKDPDRVVVAPNLFRLSAENSLARYEAAVAALRDVGVRPGARVLDIGCGISTHAPALRAFRYVGADLNAPRVTYAARQHPWARYVAQSVLEMGFRDGSFEAVVCLDVIEHLEPVVHVPMLRELLRVLADGGHLMLSTPDGRMTPWKRVFGARCERSHVRELRADEVEALVSEAGGEVVSSAVVDNFVQPAIRPAAVLAHLVADRPRWRDRIGQGWAAAGYRTLLFAARRV